MHSHLEIIMPPVDNIETAIYNLMAPYSDHKKDARHPFWDWYEIGGRWSGRKLVASLDADKLTAFNAELDSMKVTVSAVRAGKPTLQPDEQAPVVDALWNRYFPDSPLKQCPFFAHSGRSMPMDVCELGRTPLTVDAERVMIAAPSTDPEILVLETMLSQSIWNGCNFETTAWDGTLETALAEHQSQIERFNGPHRARMTPKPNWYVVTVDYHS